MSNPYMYLAAVVLALSLAMPVHGFADPSFSIYPREVSADAQATQLTLSLNHLIYWNTAYLKSKDSWIALQLPGQPYKGSAWQQGPETVTLSIPSSYLQGESVLVLLVYGCDLPHGSSAWQCSSEAGSPAWELGTAGIVSVQGDAKIFEDMLMGSSASTQGPSKITGSITSDQVRRALSATPAQVVKFIKSNFDAKKQQDLLNAIDRFFSLTPAKQNSVMDGLKVALSQYDQFKALLTYIKNNLSPAQATAVQQPGTTAARTGDFYCSPSEAITNPDCYCVANELQYCGFGATSHVCGACSLRVWSQPQIPDVNKGQILFGSGKFGAVCGDGSCIPAYGETYETCRADCSKMCSPETSYTVTCTHIFDNPRSIGHSFTGLVTPGNVLEREDLQDTIERNGKFYLKYMPGVEVPSQCISGVEKGVLQKKTLDGNQFAKTTVSGDSYCRWKAGLALTTVELRLKYRLRECEKILNLLDPSTMPPEAPQTCGDLWCNPESREDPYDCPADCMGVVGIKDFLFTITDRSCGNNICDYNVGERSQNCAADCNACSANGVCDKEEQVGRNVAGYENVDRLWLPTEGADCPDCLVGQQGELQAIVDFCSSLKGSKFGRYSAIAGLMNRPGAWEKISLP